MLRVLLCGAVFASACGSAAPRPPPTDAGTSGAGGGMATAGGAGGGGAVSSTGGGAQDPADLAPRRWPEVPSITHDVDTDLAKVLERSALENACAQVSAGATDAATRLRCGKWMFFNETFGTVGVPTPLLDFNQKHFADTFFGRGFERLGFVMNPDSAKGHPIGLAPTTGKLGSVETTAFTCASCHFGRLPDGRFAVGYANTKLQYGLFLVTLGAPLSLSFNANDPEVAPAVRMMLATPVATAKMKTGYTAEAGLVGLSLLGAGSGPGLSVAEQEKFLALHPGTMDFLTKPLLDDGVWTVSRIISLWNLPDAAQRASAGMPHERLSWNGGVQSLEDFLRGFVAIGVGAGSWTTERLAPLAEYVRSLRAPPNLSPASAAEVRDGARLFVTKGCLDCHAGPSGESARVFTFAEVGTDPVYGTIYNPGADGKPCCGLGDDPSNVTRGVKAPRMNGLFSQKRLLHNGAVEGLDALFCRVPRKNGGAHAQSDVGHAMTCDGLTEPEKSKLIAYLESL